MKARLLAGSLLVTAMTLGISAVTLANGGDDECTVATLDGLYVFTANSPPTLAPVAEKRWP